MTEYAHTLLREIIQEDIDCPQGMMIYLIGFPDQVKNKIFASLAPSWFILSFFP
jgi:hypothetical protein